MSPHENTRKKRRLSAEAEGDDAVPTKKARTDDERTVSLCGLRSSFRSPCVTGAPLLLGRE